MNSSMRNRVWFNSSSYMTSFSTSSTIMSSTILEDLDIRAAFSGRLEGGLVPVPGRLDELTGRVPVPEWDLDPVLGRLVPVPGRLVEVGSGGGTTFGRERAASISIPARSQR